MGPTIMRLGTPLVAALLLSALGFGCASPTGLYDWGRYEESVNAVVFNPERPADLHTERELLAQEIRTSLENHRRIPPGKWAHLGYLCTLTGDNHAARQHFIAEKTLFPESAALMDFLIGRLK